MRGLIAPLALVAARARRRPGRWLWPALGIAAATAFAGAVAAEGVIAGDQAARSELRALSAPDRTVRITWQGVVTPPVARRARALLSGLGLGGQTDVVLMNPVRLDGAVVRPAAIAPLEAWLGPGVGVRPGLGVGSAPRVGPCRPTSCPMLLAGGTVARRLLQAAGVRIELVGSGRLTSAAPLGYVPASSADQPLLLTGDASGLDSLAGLSGVYRTRSWLAQLPIGALHSWDLAAVERRLARAQNELLANGSQFTLAAPFDGLDAARSQAAAAPERLLLAGGGALAALAVFIVLAAGAVRRDLDAALRRLRNAGARTSQVALFVLGEAAWLSGAALVMGALLSVLVSSLLASSAGDPAGSVLSHSVLSPLGVAALAGGWICATILLAVSVGAGGDRLGDLLATGALAALAAVVAFGPNVTGNDPAAVLLAPLCCLAAGVLTFRLAALLLRAGERAVRRGPLLVRLSLVGLARAPSYPSLAIAFVAVSTSLGGFALAYRATLLRGSADQAADRVPLDATVSPGSTFATPLELAPLTRWQSLAGGSVWPVRRTDASYTSGGGTVTVPALGVPASVLARLHGWRAGDGSAPLAALATRLVPSGPVPVRGPRLPPGARWLSLRLSSPAIAVSVTAVLRGQDGMINPVSMGAAGAGPGPVRGRIPRGSWELEALQLDEPSGLEATTGHQNAENPATATQFASNLSLGRLSALSGEGATMVRIAWQGWRGVGAASMVGSRGGRAMVRFTATGSPGVLRPIQPSDLRAVPVLVDPRTGGAASAGGRLTLTVDGLPVSARIAGVLRRFPTLPSDAGGFVVADESTLAAALDGQLPGQGRPDELWISTPRVAGLRQAISHGSLSQLDETFRSDLEHQLRSAPIARAVLGTLIAATIVSALLALLGLSVALLGAGRDPHIEADLVAQGLGPRALLTELRLRMLIAALSGVGAGLAIALALTRLAVAAVRGAGTAAVPRPPLVTVTPWVALALWGIVVIGMLAAMSLLAGRSAAARRAGT